MRLRLKCYDEKTIFDHKQVPLLGWAEIARKIERFLSKNEPLVNARFNNNLAKQINEAIHLCTTRYCAS